MKRLKKAASGLSNAVSSAAAARKDTMPIEHADEFPGLIQLIEEQEEIYKEMQMPGANHYLSAKEKFENGMPRNYLDLYSFAKSQLEYAKEKEHPGVYFLYLLLKIRGFALDAKCNNRGYVSSIWEHSREVSYALAAENAKALYLLIMLLKKDKTICKFLWLTKEEHIDLVIKEISRSSQDLETQLKRLCERNLNPTKLPGYCQAVELQDQEYYNLLDGQLYKKCQKSFEAGRVRESTWIYKFPEDKMNPGLQLYSWLVLNAALTRDNYYFAYDNTLYYKRILNSIKNGNIQACYLLAMALCQDEEVSAYTRLIKVPEPSIEISQDFFNNQKHPLSVAFQRCFQSQRLFYPLQGSALAKILLMAAAELGHEVAKNKLTQLVKEDSKHSPLLCPPTETKVSTSFTDVQVKLVSNKIESLSASDFLDVDFTKDPDIEFIAGSDNYQFSKQDHTIHFWVPNVLIRDVTLSATESRIVFTDLASHEDIMSFPSIAEEKLTLLVLRNKNVLLGGASGAIYLLNTQNNKLIEAREHERTINSFLELDEVRFVSYGADKRLLVWDSNTLSCLGEYTIV